MDISKQALQLKKALNESRYTVAITGAGISFSAACRSTAVQSVANTLTITISGTREPFPDVTNAGM
ncbi:MAG: hypothetical protein LIO86_04760 [Lachnospiraceae bacterium]|nr:hypothetical protein [Lachnospiraceae bacterium]